MAAYGTSLILVVRAIINAMKATLAMSCLALVVSAMGGCSKQANVPANESNQSDDTQPTPQLVLEELAQVKTLPMNIEQFEDVVQGHSRTNLAALSDNQREKLFACLNRFYACYSTGDFEQYKQFRIHPPYQLNKAVAAAVTNAAAGEGISLTSNEDIIRFAWDRWNGTNKIGQVSPEHVVLTCVERTDLGDELKFPSVGQLTHPRSATTYSEAVEYLPTPMELWAKHGTLHFFRLELLVRCGPLEIGPASPLVLTGYWDPTRDDWMPYSLTTTFHVGGYRTIL